MAGRAKPTAGITSHFAVIGVLEDLIGSPDAESEAALIAARARAVAQLPLLARTMGRDWCVNEVTPFLARCALEDDEAVAVAAAEQLGALVETPHLSSAEAVSSILRQCVAHLLASSHSAVRHAAALASRELLARGQASPQAVAKNVADFACELIDSPWPAAQAGGVGLLEPFSRRGDVVRPWMHAVKQLTTYLDVSHASEPSSLEILRTVEAPFAGGRGRVLVVDRAVAGLTASVTADAASMQQSRWECADELLCCTMRYLRCRPLDVDAVSAMFLQTSLEACIRAAASVLRSTRFSDVVIGEATEMLRCAVVLADHPDWAVRYAVASKLDLITATCRGTEGRVDIESALSLLVDDDFEVRAAAAQSCPSLASPSAAGPIEDGGDRLAVTDMAPAVREALVVGLRDSSAAVDSRAAGELCALAADESDPVRLAANELIAQTLLAAALRGDGADMSQLTDAAIRSARSLSSAAAPWRVREAFATAIGRILRRALAPLLSGALRGWAHDWIDAAVISQARELIRDGAADVRQAALDGIVDAAESDARALEWAWQALAPPSDVRQYQVRITRLQFACVAASPADLMAELNRAVVDPVPNVRRAAARGILGLVVGAAAKQRRCSSADLVKAASLCLWLPKALREVGIAADTARVGLAGMARLISPSWCAEALSTLLQDPFEIVREAAAQGFVLCE